MMLSCLILVSLLLQVRLYHSPSGRLYFLNGLFYLLACAAKYNAVFLGFSFCAAHIFSIKKQSGTYSGLWNARAVLFFGLGVILGGMLGFPIIQLSGGGDFIGSLVFEFKHLFVKGHPGLKISGLDYFYMFHWLRSILPMAGYVLFGFMIGGIALFVFNADKKKWIILFFAIPYYCAMEYIFKVAVDYERYVLPLVGIYVICAVFAVQWLCCCIQSRFSRANTIILYGLIVILCAFPLYKTTRFLYTLDPDTRTQTKRWMKRNIPAGSKIAVHWPNSGYHPDLKKMGYEIVEVKSSEKNFSEIFFQSEYIIVTSLCYDRYFRDTQGESPLKEYYKAVFAMGAPVYEAVPSYMTYRIHNPVVKIYKVEI